MKTLLWILTPLVYWALYTYAGSQEYSLAIASILAIGGAVGGALGSVGSAVGGALATGAGAIGSGVGAIGSGIGGALGLGGAPAALGPLGAATGGGISAGTGGAGLFGGGLGGLLGAAGGAGSLLQPTGASLGTIGSILSGIGGPQQVGAPGPGGGGVQTFPGQPAGSGVLAAGAPTPVTQLGALPTSQSPGSGVLEGGEAQASGSSSVPESAFRKQKFQALEALLKNLGGTLQEQNQHVVTRFDQPRIGNIRNAPLEALTALGLQNARF